MAMTAFSTGPRHLENGDMADMTSKELKALIEADPELRTITLEQISEAYDVSTRSLLRYIAGGELRAVRFGRRYMVTLAALKEFLGRRQKSPQKRGPSE